MYGMKLDVDRKISLVKEKGFNYPEQKRLDSPGKIAHFLKKTFDVGNLAEEYFYMLAFDIRCNLLGIFEIAHGSSSEIMVTPREIYQRALIVGANHIVIVHNHPSGDISPSREDILFTERITKVGKLLGLKLMDHIITGDGYLSFYEENLLDV